MLLPEFGAVAADVALRARAVLAADLDATLVPDLLAAVDVRSALARRVGLTACQTFADVRVEQPWRGRADVHHEKLEAARRDGDAGVVPSQPAPSSKPSSMPA